MKEKEKIEIEEKKKKTKRSKSVFTVLTFRPSYFSLSIILFVIELLIGLYVKDRLIRPYVGDLLVVTLIYCFLRSFLTISVFNAAIGTLVFAYLVELLQYLNFISFIGLQQSQAANIILGNRFEWIDMIAYTLGIGSVLVFERKKLRT